MRKKIITIALTTAMASGLFFNITTMPASAKSNNDNNSKLQVISKVYDDNGGGYIRSHFVDNNGNKFNLKTASNASSIKIFKAASNLPSSYSLVETNMITPIKDQGVTGACWSFAAVKAAESNYIMKGFGTVDTTDFSENHLCWFTFHPNLKSSSGIYNDGFYLNGSSRDTVYSCGGNALMAIAKLATWTGFDIEANAPFSANTTTEENNMSSFMHSSSEKLRSNSVSHLQNAICYDNAPLADIKQAILDNGALDIAMYYDESGFENSSGKTGKSYYNSGISNSMAVDMANHCVTIVGWDDNYSRDNFKNKPSNDGAWLIANSYGTTYNENGYFWLSYYEPSINEIYSFDVEKTDNYSNNYQYDGSGWHDAPYYTDTDISGANVFTAGKSYNQTLKSVGFYTITDAQAYTISVYRFLSGSSPSSGTLISQCTTSGTAQYSGYHTVSLKKPCKISAGEKFAVAIKYHYNSLTKDKAYLPCEGSSQPYGMSTGISFSATSKPGQSFISTNGKWTDTTNITRYILNNVCIKAFTVNNSAPVTAKSGSNKNVILGKGETYKLPSGSSSSYVNNESFVATVSSSGKITATNIGKTVIGIAGKGTDNYKSTVTVTVKKAPTKITLKPSGKKTLKKGKSFTIKTALPSGAASNKLTFTSSNKKIASVSSKGKVTAKKKGKATITVKTFNKKSAKIKVTVK